MNKLQDLKCFLHLHKYEIYKEEECKDVRGNVIGKIIISRCSNCDKIKSTIIETVKNY